MCENCAKCLLNEPMVFAGSNLLQVNDFMFDRVTEQPIEKDEKQRISQSLSRAPMVIQQSLLMP